MPKSVKLKVTDETLFEIEDVLGRKIRTTKTYWKKIKEIKHRELRYGINEVQKTLTQPDEIRLSMTDSTILLYANKIKDDILVVTVKILNGNGFLVTAYQTRQYKKKGEMIWLKPKER